MFLTWKFFGDMVLVASGPPRPSTAMGRDGGGTPKGEHPLRGVGGTGVANHGFIEGQVVDGLTGVGIHGAEVTLFGPRGAITERTTPDGRFSIVFADGGSHQITSVTAPGYSPYAQDPAGPLLIATARKKRGVPNLKLTIFPLREVRGLVVDSDEQPVPKARVRLLSVDGPRQSLIPQGSEWTTDASGRFVAVGAQDGVLEASTVNGERGSARVGFDEGEITLRVRSRRRPIGGSLRGRVSRQDGSAVEGIAVVATNELGGSCAMELTDEGGLFKFADLVEGPTTVAVTGTTELAPASRTVMVPETLDASLVVDSGALVSGHVVDEQGRAVPTFTVIVKREDEGAGRIVLVRTVIDPDGRFEFRLTPGKYGFYALGHGLGASRDVSLEVEAGAEIELVVMRGVQFFGRVVDEGGRAIRGARVRIDGLPTMNNILPVTPSAVTDSNGYFSMRGVPRSRGLVRIEGEGASTLQTSESFDAGDVGPVSYRLWKRGQARRPEGSESPGAISGIGARVSWSSVGLTVVDLIDRSGAAAAGLERGDLIIEVDGFSLNGAPIQTALSHLRGPAGSRVTLVVVKRAGIATEIVVVRGEVPL